MENKDSMENTDFIRESILAIEDFDNVSHSLMEKINGNEEYRRLFEEYRELSALISESAPSPEKDGVTLHDAVMKRIKDGDTAPRYINTSKFKFPVATVASIAVMAAVVIIMKNGAFKNKTPDSAYNNMKSAADVSVEETSGSDGNTFFMSRTSGGTESASEDILLQSVEESETVNTETYSAENGGIALASIETETASAPAYSPDDEAVEAEYDESAAESDYTAIERQQTNTPGSGWTYSADSDNENAVLGGGYAFDDNEEITVDTAKSAVPEAKNSLTTSETFEEDGEEILCAYPTLEAAEEAVEEAEEAAEEPQSSLNPEVSSRMAYAAKVVPEENIMTCEEIYSLGGDRYIAWFDEIYDKENFASLYTFENFEKYCENAK